MSRIPLWLKLSLVLVSVIVSGWLAVLLTDESLIPAPDLTPRLPALKPSENGLRVLIATVPPITVRSHSLREAKAHLASGEKPAPLLLAPLLAAEEDTRVALAAALQYSRWALHGRQEEQFAATAGSDAAAVAAAAFDVLTAAAVMDASSGRELRALDTAHDLLDALECMARGAACAEPTVHCTRFFNSGTHLGVMERLLDNIAVIFLHCAKADRLPEVALRSFLDRVDEVTAFENLLTDALLAGADVHRRFLADPGRGRTEKLGAGAGTVMFLPVATANQIAGELRAMLVKCADWQRGTLSGNDLEHAVQRPFRRPGTMFSFLLPNRGGTLGLWSNSADEAVAAHALCRIRLADRRAQLLTAVASVLYRKKHGRAAVKIQDLVPEFMSSVLLDPWDGSVIDIDAWLGLIRSSRAWPGKTPAIPSESEDLLGSGYMRLPY